MKKEISTDAAPLPIGAYSQAMEAGGWVFVSGQIGLNLEGELHVEAMAQVRQAFSNLLAVAQAAGLGLDHVVKLTIYLMDMGHFSLVNEEITQRFHPPFPARSVVQAAGLPRGALVEVEAILCRDPGP